MKKRTTRLALVVAALALPLLAAGCSKEPTAEIEAADVALENARQAEAPAYAPEAMQVAQQAHAELKTELAEQKENSAFGRSYDRARELAVEAQQASEEAIEAAEAGKLQARNDATAMLAELRTSVDETKTLLDNAPTGKGAAADLEALRGDLDAVDIAMTDIERAISSEQFMGALEKAEAAMANTNDIRAEIERAADLRRSAGARHG